MVNKYHISSRQVAPDWIQILLYGMLLFLVSALYVGIGIKLAHDWITLPDFSHGFLIPFFAAFVIWRLRHRVANTATSSDWWGLVPVVMGLLLLLLGVLGSELYLARLSFLFVASGTLWLLFGRQLLQTLWFPTAVLLLAIPIPQVIFYQLTAPLQRLAATCATQLLPLLGVPALQHGNIIQLPSISLEVAEACSGIRSLLSLSTLSVIYGYFAEPRPWRRVFLVAASIPIAVAANAMRIVGTGILVKYRGVTMAMGFFHEFAGVLVFIVSIALLMGIHMLLRHLPLRP